jgi:hypothetical protein
MKPELSRPKTAQNKVTTYHRPQVGVRRQSDLAASLVVDRRFS